MAGPAGAQSIWSGHDFEFVKPNGTDWTLSENQDRITENVWITRASFGGIFNIAREGVFQRNVSPIDTEWAFGRAGDWELLAFTDWTTWVAGSPPGTVGRDAVVHLITDDIYIDIRFTSWSCCGAGGFSYVRAVPAPAAVVPFAAGLLLARRGRRRG